MEESKATTQDQRAMLAPAGEQQGSSNKSRRGNQRPRATYRGYHPRGGHSRGGRGYGNYRGQGFRKSPRQESARKEAPSETELDSTVKRVSEDDQDMSKRMSNSEGAVANESHDLSHSHASYESSGYGKFDKRNDKDGNLKESSKKDIVGPASIDAGTDKIITLNKSKGKNRKFLDKQSREQSQRSAREISKGGAEKGGPLKEKDHSCASKGSCESTTAGRGQRQVTNYPSPRRGENKLHVKYNDDKRGRWSDSGSTYGRGAGIYGFPNETYGAHGTVPHYMHYQYFHGQPYNNYYLQNAEHFMPPGSHRSANSDNFSNYGFEHANNYHVERGRGGNSIRGRRQISVKSHQVNQPRTSNKVPSTRRNTQGQSWREDVANGAGISNFVSVQSVQASVLMDQLRTASYECMVCCEAIKFAAAVWSCHNCYHVFHLSCAKKWANSPSALVQGTPHK